MKKESFRDQLLKLKQLAWEKEDYRTVKAIRIRIKEYDKQKKST